MKKYVEMSFNADLKNVVFARGVVTSFFLDEEVSLNIINEIKTIVSEGVTNAIVHGYQHDKTKLVHLIMELDESNFHMEISDDGVGIDDVTQAMQPLYSTKKSEERAGLGFTIMDIFSDSLLVESQVNVGTQIRITKNLEA